MDLVRYTPPPALPTPDDQGVLHEDLRAWAREALRLARERATGGPSDRRYLHARRGTYARAIRAHVTRNEATLSVTHVGARVHEYGAVIRPTRGRYLTFRLYRPGDTTRPTGRWVRARQVVIPARRIITRSGDDALRILGGP